MDGLYGKVVVKSGIDVSRIVIAPSILSISNDRVKMEIDQNTQYVCNSIFDAINGLESKSDDESSTTATAATSQSLLEELFPTTVLESEETEKMKKPSIKNKSKKR